MGLSFDAFTDILKHFEVSYWTSADRPAVMFGMAAASGRRYMIGASIDGEGSFFQVRSVEYAYCPMTHRHFGAVAKLLLGLNYHYRAIKFALDPQDGEVAVFGDLVLLDAAATSAQVMGLLGFYLNVLDDSHERIQVTLVTGDDPGEKEKEAVPAPEEEAPAPGSAGGEDVI